MAKQIKSIEELIEQYHDNHDVVYELRVLVDDEVLFKETSGISADDVSMSAYNLDQAVEKHIVSEEEERLEYEEEARAEAQMQEELDNGR